ncbi:hypothetical protein [Pacificispira sp.]|uniref:hypothetical protein n=1 Tax=Pacificispira sp. TaxID=2888761 RepID=UPI003BA99B34
MRVLIAALGLSVALSAPVMAQTAPETVTEPSGPTELEPYFCGSFICYRPKTPDPTHRWLWDAQTEYWSGRFQTDPQTPPMTPEQSDRNLDVLLNGAPPLRSE